MTITIRLASATVGLAIFAAALPGAALAQTAAPFESTGTPKAGPIDYTAAKDAPKAQGWQTGAGEMSDEDCQGFADQIQDAIDAGIKDLDSNDIDGAIAEMDLIDSLDSLAGEMGCAISYPQKTAAPGKSHIVLPAGAVGASFKVEGWQTGGGSISDQSCQNFADRIGEQLDAASEDADAGDLESMENHLQGAEAWESMATDYGCAIKY